MKNLKWHQTMFMLALAMGQAIAGEKAFDYVLPHIPGSAQPEEAGFLVEAALLNPNPTAITIELVWYESDEQGNYRHNQEAGGTLILHPNATTDLQLDTPTSSGSGQRWLGIRTDGQTLLGYYSFTYRDADGNHKYQAALPMTAPLPANEPIIISHIAQNRGYFVGLALTNLSAQPNQISQRAYNAAGEDRSHYLKAAEHHRVLAPHQKRIANFDSLFVDGAYEDGSKRDIAWIELASSQPLAGLELFGSRDPDESGFVLNQLAGLAVTAATTAGGSQQLPLNLLDNDYVGFTVLNPSTETLKDVAINFYHKDGSLAAAANLDLPAASKQLGVHIKAGNLIYPYPSNIQINEPNVHPLGAMVVEAPVKLLSLFGTAEGYEGLQAGAGARNLGLLVPPQQTKGTRRLVAYSATAGQLQIRSYNKAGIMQSLHTEAVAANQQLEREVHSTARYIQLKGPSGGQHSAYLLETRTEDQEHNRTAYVARPIATVEQPAYTAEVRAAWVTHQGAPYQAAILGERLSVALPPLNEVRYTLQTEDLAGNPLGEQFELSRDAETGLAAFDTGDARHGLENGQTYQLNHSAWDSGGEIQQQHKQRLTIDMAAYLPDAKLREKLGQPTTLSQLQRTSMLLRDEAAEVTSLRGLEKITDLKTLYLEVTAPGEAELDLSALSQLEELSILLMNGNLRQLILPAAAPLRTITINGAPLERLSFSGKPTPNGSLATISLEYCAQLRELDLTGLPHTATPLTVHINTCPAFTSLKMAAEGQRSGTLALNLNGTAVETTNLLPEPERAGFIQGDSLSLNGETVQLYPVTMAVASGRGGTVQPGGTALMPAGSQLTLSQTPWASHYFIGWQGVPAGREHHNPLQIEIDRPYLISAEYQEKSYRITTNIDPMQGTIIPATASVVHNGTLNLTLHPNPNYHNPAWSDAGDATAEGYSLFLRNVRENRDIGASLVSQLTVEVTVQPAGGGQIKPSAIQQLEAGESVTLEAEANAPYVFAGWQGVPAEQSQHNPLTLTNVTASMVLIARFDHTIEVTEVAGNGRTNPSAGTYPVAEGASFSILAQPNSARDQFTGWGEGVAQAQRSNPNLTLTEVRQSITLRPSFVRQYSIEVSAGAGGSTDRDGTHLVEDGQTFTVTATPASDYVFSRWEGNPPAAQATNLTLTLAAVDRDYELEAVFTDPTVTYTLTVNALEGGTTNRDGVSTYIEGTGVFVLATAADGWVFTGWSGDNQSTINPVEIVMDTDKVITAHFANERTVSIAVQPAGSGTTSPAVGDHIVLYSSDLTVTARPAAHYVFSHWSGAATGTAATTTLQSIQEDQQLTANFERIMHQVDISVEFSDSGTTNPTSGLFPEGQQLSITAIPNEGNDVIDWALDGEAVRPKPNPIETYTFTVTGDHTVVVYFGSSGKNKQAAGTSKPVPTMNNLNPEKGTKR